MQRLPRYV